MTRTLAAKVMEGFHSQGWRPLGHGGTWAGAMRPLEEYVKRRVERAVKAEREACAKVVEQCPWPRWAEGTGSRSMDAREVFADAIRARETK